MAAIENGPAERPRPATELDFGEPTVERHAIGVIPPAAVSAGVLSREEVARLKAATAMILTAKGSGSGFLLGRTSEGYLLLTNHHVVGSAGHRARVVLDSGSAAPQIGEGEVVAADSELDLAAVLVKGLPAGQQTLQLADASEVYETQPVLVVGFPLGGSLGGSSFPAPTFGRGAVGSLRLNSRGELEAVQLDANLNPGNSGGPVLDLEGQVIGMAMSGIATTDISFVIPAGTIERFLEGSISEVAFQTLLVGDRTLAVTSFRLADPLERIQEVGVRQVRSGEDLPRQPTVAELGAVAPRKGEGHLRFDLRGRRGDVIWLQPWYRGTRERRDLSVFRAVVGEVRETHPVYSNAEKLAAAGTGHSWGKGGDWTPVDEVDDSWTERVRGSITKASVPLPEPALDARLAGGGRYVVCQLGDSGLAVFDLVSGQLERTLDFHESILFAAGGDTVVVFHASTQVFEVYDLPALEHRSSLANPFPGTVLAIEMGRSNGRFAVVSVDSGPSLRRLELGLLNLRSGRSARLGLDRHECSRIIIQPERVRLRADASLGRLAIFELGHSRSLALLTLDGSSTSCRRGPGVAAGGVSLTDDGQLYTMASNGSLILSADLKELRRIGHQHWLYPSPEGGLYLQVRHDNVRHEFEATLFSASSQKMITTVPLPEEWFPERYHYGTGLPPEFRLFFLAEAGAIIGLPASAPSLELRRFDLQKLLRAERGNYLVIASRPPLRARRGEALTYALDVLSRDGGVRYILDQGASEMRLSNDGMLSWEVPEDRFAPQPVIIRVDDHSGEVAYQSFTIEIE